MSRHHRAFSALGLQGLGLQGLGLQGLGLQGLGLRRLGLRRLPPDPSDIVINGQNPSRMTVALGAI